MRAGELRHRATVLALSPALAPVVIGQRWVGIRTKESADAPAATGLRASTLVEIRARFSETLLPGRYLRHGSRLFHITSVRDFRGDRAELVMTCEELIGEPAEYRPAGGAPVPCRAFVAQSAPYLDDQGQVTEYRTRAEVTVIEVGRPQVDDQLQVGGVLYTVIRYADESDDGVVRGLWLEVA